MNSKSIIKLTFVLGLLLPFLGSAQINQKKDSTLIVGGSGDDIVQNKVKASDTVTGFSRYRADGVSAVVGDFLILQSDVEKTRQDLKTQGRDDNNITDCQLVGRLMENKLYAHEAELDSTIVVSDARIQSQVEQQITQMKEYKGGIDAVLEFYRKDSEQALRDELFKIDKEQVMSNRMQAKIVEDVEITPEEVRNFFNKIPKDERPKFGDEVEIAQLVIEPKVPPSEKKKVIDRLNEMRTDILENGVSFATKAVLYSQDASSSNGGKMTITRESPLDKDFKQVAFSLREGEVSKPFKSSFGYHIIQLDKVRGQKLDIRHIIMIPQVTDKTVDAAEKRIDSIRKLIKDDKINFDEAARRFSDQEETRGDGGQLINPETGDTRFELTKVDPLIYNQVQNLKEGEVSTVLTDQTKNGKKFFKIITITGRYPSHIADYAKDYSKIKELALKEKQFKAIAKWQKEKIGETYIKVGDKYKDCDFKGNWLKK